MKHIGVTASVIQNTNRVVGSSDADWAYIKNGAFFKFAKDNQLYNVSHTSKFVYMKDFSVITPKLIRVNGHTGIDLCEGDMLNIFYNEYELLTVIKIVQKGQKYKIGDIIEIIDGSPVVNISDNIPYYTKFMVGKVNKNGGIESISIKHNGKYNAPPKHIVMAHGGNGQGAQLETEYHISGKKTLLERHITNIIQPNSQNHTEIHLDYKLPEGIKLGNLSVQKWELFLNGNFNGGDQKNAQFHIIQDFTEHLHLPLMLKGSLSVDNIFNLCMNAIDSKLHELEQKLTSGSLK